jgi:hypothetical protein
VRMSAATKGRVLARKATCTGSNVGVCWLKVCREASGVAALFWIWPHQVLLHAACDIHRVSEGFRNVWHAGHAPQRACSS